MWIPRTQEELEQAITSASVEESSIFDAKKELPSKSPEIAKDIAAMANDGGVLIYGIDEDEQGRPTRLNPIPLAGQPERINSIVQTSIQESPVVSISTIPTSDDPSIGYLIVAVPASERAPHMVVVKGDNRYYGRTATGNLPLSEGDVARLYERRRRWEMDREVMLEGEVQRAPLAPVPDYAYLHLIAQPVITRDTLLDQATRPGQTQQGVLYDLVGMVCEGTVYPHLYVPDFRLPSQWLYRPDGFYAQLDSLIRDYAPRAAAHTLDLQVDFNGTGHLFCGRAAERSEQRLELFPTLVAGNTLRFLTLLGMLYDRAHYIGQVDVGLAITGLQGAVPSTSNYILRATPQPYTRDEYRRTERVSAIELKAGASDVAKRLLMPLFNTLGQGRLDPFTNPQT